LLVEVTVGSDLYSPGDAVNYQITVKDRKTKKVVNNKEVLISVTVTDESVFAKIEDRKLPPSLGAAVYLENEVFKIENELYYSNQYIDHWFQDQKNAVQESNDRNLELLLGVQGWRSNAFDLPIIYDVS
jgi:DNA-directed RNA polymerase